MIKITSPLHRKILALSLLLFVIWMVVGSLMLPSISYFSDRHVYIAMLETRAVKYHEIIDQEAGLSAQLERLTNEDIPDLLYHGASEADLNAQLQGDIRNLFSRADANIDDMRSLSSTEEDGLQRVNLHMSLQLSMDAFVDLLEAVQSHHKIIDFDNISIKIDRRHKDDVPPSLQIEWQVIGFGLLSDGEAA